MFSPSASVDVCATREGKIVSHVRLSLCLFAGGAYPMMHWNWKGGGSNLVGRIRWKEVPRKDQPGRTSPPPLDQVYHAIENTPHQQEE